MPEEPIAGPLPEWLEPYAAQPDQLRRACEALLGMTMAFAARMGSELHMDLGELFSAALGAVESGPRSQAGPELAMEAVLREVSAAPTESVIPDLDPDTGA